MALNFPNASRSYDRSRDCVRFWGHDGVVEVAFMVAADALLALEPATVDDESGWLHAFDVHRDKVLTVAEKAYSKAGHASYTLGPSDF